MAEPQRRTDAEPHVAANDHFLIVEGRFYDDIGEKLLAGTKAALETAGATYDVVTMPGALEVPVAIAMAIEAADRRGATTRGPWRSAASCGARPTTSRSSRTRAPAA